MKNPFEKLLPGQEIETSEVVERFGDSLAILGMNERVQRHLKDLEKLPGELVRVMREKGLRVVVGEGDIINLMSEIPGVWSSVSRLVEKFLARERDVEVTVGGWRRTERRRAPVPLGAYYEPLKIAFVGEGPQYQFISAALHEYGHGVGHLLKLNRSKTLKEAHLRLYPKLPSFLQCGRAGNLWGRKELLADSFLDYFTLSRESFIYYHDEQLYLFWEDIIDNIGDYLES